MIANRSRDSRRSKLLRMPKNIQRLYKEGKCNDCSVVVTRMDFAKILGKFTKVKIQYESSTVTRPTRTTTTPISPNNSRLKSNENGMVLIHRNAYSQHPVKTLTAKKSKANNLKENTPQQEKNVLRENNKVKKTPMKDKNANNNKMLINKNYKQYGIVFINPKIKKKNDFNNKFSLSDLLPNIKNNILPSEEWHIDYFPKDSEPKDDKVYDRIAAELEDLMYDDNKPVLKLETKTESTESKTDDFPSIMDILNDNTTSVSQKAASTAIKSSLESNDVEAMLLGKTSEKIEDTKLTPVDVDPSDVTKLIADVAQLTDTQIDESKLNTSETMDLDNPNSPSILGENTDQGNDSDQPHKLESSTVDIKIENIDTTKLKDKKEKSNVSIPNNVTHVIFRKSIDGKCEKSVTCPKNLKYSVELEGKSVEFLGAPKFISSLEDLEVLLQIVNESKLNNLYVLY